MVLQSLKVIVVLAVVVVKILQSGSSLIMIIQSLNLSVFFLL